MGGRLYDSTAVGLLKKQRRNIIPGPILEAFLRKVRHYNIIVLDIYLIVR